MGIIAWFFMFRSSAHKRIAALGTASGYWRFTAKKSGTEAAPAVTAVVPPTDAVAAKDTVNAGEEAKAVKDAAKGEAQASPVKEDVTIDARSSLDQSFDQLAEVKNGTYDMDLAASAPMGS